MAGALTPPSGFARGAPMPRIARRTLHPSPRATPRQPLNRGALRQPASGPRQTYCTTANHVALVEHRVVGQFEWRVFAKQALSNARRVSRKIARRPKARSAGGDIGLMSPTSIRAGHRAQQAGKTSLWLNVPWGPTPTNCVWCIRTRRGSGLLRPELTESADTTIDEMNSRCLDDSGDHRILAETQIIVRRPGHQRGK